MTRSMPCSARMGTHCSRITAWGVGEAATVRVTVSAASSPAVSAVSSAAVSSVLPPQAARDRHRVRPSSRASSFFFMSIPPINHVVVWISFKRRLRSQKPGGEDKGDHLMCRNWVSRLKKPARRDVWSNRLSMRRDSQLKTSCTTCTRMTRNTTVTHMTEVMPRW